MIEFYAFNGMMRIILFFAAFLCVIFQTASFQLYQWYGRTGYTKLRRNILELLILMQIVIDVLLISQVQSDFYIPPFAFTICRYVVLCLLTVAAFYFGFRQKNLRVLLIPFMALLTLPVLETLHSPLFSVFYGVSLGYFLVRSIYFLRKGHESLNKAISAWSIKEAIDALPAGVLFCTTNDNIILMNNKMRHLMIALTGKIWRDGEHFYDLLKEEKVLQGIETNFIENQMVYSLPDGTSWMFYKSPVMLQGKNYFQITAIDVTKRWQLTKALQRQNRALQNSSEELKVTLNDLAAIRHDEALIRVKTKVHDLMSQRITLLLRALRENTLPDEDLLAQFSMDLFAEIRAEDRDISSAEKLQSLTETFQSIGVTIRFPVDLLSQCRYSELLVDIVREAVNNAVKHGYANEIDVQCLHTDTDLKLVITDNGIPPDGEITEGGGITEMRRKLHLLGGELTITTTPRMTIVARIPKGDELI